MDGNKDEALRCLKLAEAALASRDKEKTLKFVQIAKRLDPEIPVDGLLAACENLDSYKSQCRVDSIWEAPTCSNALESSNGDRNYTEENVKLIIEIKKGKNYYAILGVEKSCSVEEIRKAYRKLSLKVHPDKNKAPGADEAFKIVSKAFKIVSKAFKCLSEEETRRRYDQTCFVEGYEFEQQYSNVRRRRRRAATRSEFFDDNSDPDEIFRSFFYGNQGNVFRAQQVYRARRAAGWQREPNVQGGFNWMVLLQILPILFFFVFASLPLSELHYSLQRTYGYQIPRVTEMHGVEYYVKLADFDEKLPQGSSARNKIENNVLRDYKSILGRYCHVEIQRRQWVRDYPTPNCDKLRSFAVE